MKAFIKPLIFSFLLLSLSCSKEEDCDNPVDCLPSATQIGANTAGCLVNGETLLPGGRHLGSGSVLHSQYLFYENEYVFSMSFSNKNNDLIQLRSRGVKLEKGKIYALAKNIEGSISAAYLIRAGLEDGFVTTEAVTGEFKVTHLDESKNILSGAFWFDAVNGSGEVVEIREGRFDVRYQ